MPFYHLSHLGFIRIGLALAVGLLWTQSAAAADPDLQYFRADFGRAAHAGPLPDRLDAPSALVWRVPLDSGHSTPLVRNGKIFLTTFHPGRKELATVALDQGTGRVLWKQVVPAEAIEQVHPKTGNAATPSPACDGRQLYVFFGSYGLIAYDLDGRVVWEKRIGPFQDEYGAGSSPLLADNKIVLVQDHDIDSFIMALDRSTGHVVWKTPRPEAVRSYASPVLWSHAGRTELLVAGALELAGYNLDTGQRLWSKHGLARIVIPLPVPSGDIIYMASWAPGADSGKRIALAPWPDALAKWDKNQNQNLARNEIDDPEVLDRFFRMDLDQNGQLNQNEWQRHAAVFIRAQNAILALKPTGRGELTEQSVVWKYSRGVPYVATPLLDQGIVWMVKDGGIVTKLDAAQGRLLQEERLPGFGNYFASPVAGDSKIYFAGELGVVSVVANQPAWRVISSYDFKEKIYASPLIDRDRLYIRTEKALYAFGAPLTPQ